MDVGIWKPQLEAAYPWPRVTDKEEERYILAGRLEDLPLARSKVVRIFLSSTFTDTYAERNMLMKETFPKLRAICRERYGLDFQVVDMRWGVRDEASDDHSASELCMRELHSCQQLSIGPTFVTLLGQRYGSRPIPKFISQDHMSLILESGLSAEENELLRHWYREDTNAVPPHWTLQSLSRMAEVDRDFYEENRRPYKPVVINDGRDLYTELLREELEEDEADEEAEHKIEVQKYWRKAIDHGRKLWRKAEPKVAEIVRRWARKVEKDGTLGKTTAQGYIQSVTEEEVLRGLLNDPEPNEHCLCFIRELTDINVEHSKAWRFIDQFDNGEVDSTAQDELTALKYEKIPAKLCDKNIFKYDVPWSDKDGVNADDHKEYLNEFRETMETEILRLIQGGVDKISKNSSDSLLEEILEHGHHAVNKCQRFHGREEVMNEISKYLTSDAKQPLVVFGESGSGKTSVMAKVALRIPVVLGDHQDLSIVVRFLGTSRNSSNIADVLKSVIAQISRILGVELGQTDASRNFNDIKDQFSSAIKKIPMDKRFVIILDSLDQLSGAHEAYGLRWLPTQLPANVKLIVSTLPKAHKILETLKNMDMSPDQFVEVEPFDVNDSKAVLDLWLTQQNRQLTDKQWGLVLPKLRRKLRPLYLKLLFDEIVTWHSYEAELEAPQGDISTYIIQLFDKLEIKHGAVLVQRALSYLIAAKNGLTELEIEDLLSLDDEVLNDVFEYHIPPTRHLPSILWARIRADIDEYIVDREADGSRVMAWYHRQFAELGQRYFPTKPVAGDDAYSGRRRKPTVKAKYKHKQITMEFQSQVALNLYEYFLNKWGTGDLKPFTYNERQRKKLGLDSPNSQENRYVTPQPSIFKPSTGSIDLQNIKFNRRKVAELPNAFELLEAVTKPHLSHEELMKYMSDLCFNYEFLLSWNSCVLWSGIYKFIEGLTENHGDREGEEGFKMEMELLLLTVFLCSTTIYDNPTSLATQLAGRLYPYRGSLPLITHLIDDIEKSASSTSALLAPHFNLEAPGGGALYVVANHIGPVNDCLIATNAVYSVSKKFVMTSMEAGEVVSDFKPADFPEDDEFAHLCETTDNNSERPRDWRSLAYSGQPIACASLKKNPWIYIMESLNSIVHHVVKVEEIIDDRDSFHTIDGLDILQDYLVAFCNRSSSLILVHAITGRCIHIFNGEGNVQCARFVVFNTKAFLVILRKNNSKLMVQFIHVGTGKVTDASSSQTVYVELTEILDNWFTKEGTVVDLPTSSPLVDCKVSAVKNYLLVALQDGTMSYFLGTNPEHFQIFKYRSNFSDISDSDEDDDDIDPTRKKTTKPLHTDNDFNPHEDYAYEKFQHDDLSCIQRTIYTGYSPVHSVSLFRVSILEGLLLSLACTEHALILYQMDNASPVVKIRKRYDDATCTGTGKFIIACAKTVLDVFVLRMKSDGVGVAHFASVDAHSRPITKIGVFTMDTIFYTSSRDGTLKFWNIEKMATGNLLPKFDRVDYIISNVSCGGDSPENIIAVTASEYPASHMDVWLAVTGRLLGTLNNPNSAQFVSHHIHEWRQGRWALVAMDTKGCLLVWDLMQLRTQDGSIPTSTLPVLNQVVLSGIPSGQRCPRIIILSRPSENGAVVVDCSGKRYVNVYFSDSLGNVTCDLKTTDAENVESAFVLGSELHLKAGDKRQVYGSQSYRVITSREAGAEYSASSDGGTLLEKTSAALTVTDADTETVSFQLELRQVDRAALSADGHYLIWTSGKLVKAVRVSDGRLLASVTLYDLPDSLVVTPDGWFVAMGMPDGRLYFLLIVDPNEPDHRNRMATTRLHNPDLGDDVIDVGERATKRDDDFGDRDHELSAYNFTTDLDMSIVESKLKDSLCIDDPNVESGNIEKAVDHISADCETDPNYPQATRLCSVQ